MNRENFFQYVVGLSALLVAGSAAYYSVFGLSKLFSGAMFAVVVMAGSLEFAKLVSASFLYRYWDRVNKVLKIYMTVGVVVLVFVTSAGIFGFLSNAYQGATVQFEKESTALLYKEDRLEQLSEDKKFLKEELEVAVSELPDNFRTAKRKLREEYQPKINKINTDMMTLKSEIGDLKIILVETGIDVGPAIYLARVFGTDVDTVVKFFIFILIFVFDPMAISLVIAYNRILEDNIEVSSDTDIPTKKKWWEVYGENKKEFKVNVAKTVKNDSRFNMEDKKVVELHPDSEDLPDIDKVIDSSVKKEKIGRGGVAGR
tara:strand:- start:895 stop:1839 length:945 start_codon:yes stop_codon:yes gene_type:complete